jgi:hypothetical protein
MPHAKTGIELEFTLSFGGQIHANHRRAGAGSQRQLHSRFQLRLTLRAGQIFLEPPLMSTMSGGTRHGPVTEGRDHRGF